MRSNGCGRRLVLSGVFLLLSGTIWFLIITDANIIRLGGINPRIIKNFLRFGLLPVACVAWYTYDPALKVILARVRAFLVKPQVLWGLFIGATLLCVWLKWSQHYTFRTGAFDLALYDSALSNTLQGKFMFTTWLERNFFSEHFAPILLLLLPFYGIYDGPVVLVLAQAIMVGLSLMPLFAFARQALSSTLMALCLALVYLNYYYLLNGLMFDFHMEIFMPVCLFAVFWFLYQNAPCRYVVCLCLALACKEDMPIYCGCIGLYAWVVKRQWKLGLFTLVLSGLWAAIAWKIAIPLSYPEGRQPSHFLLRWEAYGESYTQIAWELLTHPSIIFNRLFWEHSWSLLRPLAGVPLLDCTSFALALPALIINVTSNFESQRNLGVHYALPLLPFVFIALILGLKNLVHYFPRKRSSIFIVIGFYLLVMNTHLYPLVIDSVRITQHDLTGHRLLQTLPDTARIAAQTSLIPHLRRTQQVALLPQGIEDAEYLLFDAERFKWPLSDEQYYQLLGQIRDDPAYRLVVEQQGFYFFQRQ